MFSADQDTNDVIELYSVNIDGTNLVKLHSNLGVGRNVSTALNGFVISPDSQKVVFAGDLDTNDVMELYSVNLDGTGLIKVSGSLVTGGDVSTKRLCRIIITKGN